MRVRTVESIVELQGQLGLSRPGLLLEADLDRFEPGSELPESRRRDAEVLCTLAANVAGDCLDLGPATARGAFRFASNLRAGGRVFTRSTQASLPDHDGSDETRAAIADAIHPWNSRPQQGPFALSLVNLTDPADVHQLDPHAPGLIAWHGFDPERPEAVPPEWHSDSVVWVHLSGSNLLVTDSTGGRAASAASSDWPAAVDAAVRRPGSAHGQVSVIIPNYNHGRYLPEAIEAVFQQSVQPVEVLVIEHGSTDNSVEVLERLSDRHPLLRWVGASRERHFLEHVNDQAQRALGEFIYFGAADDFILPGLFERSLALLARHPKAAFCATPVRLADPQSRLLDLYPAPHPSDTPAYVSPERNLELLRDHLGGWAMGNGCLTRRSVLLEAGPFDLSLGSFCDGFLRMAMGQRWGACFVPEPSATWRKLEDGYASTAERDKAKLLACYRRAKELMETRYAGWFPEDFIQLFTDRLITPLEPSAQPNQ